MGLVHAELRLSNAAKPHLVALTERALVDTGAAQLCVPERVAVQLELDEVYRREVMLADGSRRRVPYVGPVKCEFGNRGCLVGAFVLGDEVLMGSIPTDDMDLVISPLRGTVEANPMAPDIPSAVVK